MQTTHQSRASANPLRSTTCIPTPWAIASQEAAETGLAQKTGATAQHINRTQPIRKKREVGERYQLRFLRTIC